MKLLYFRGIDHFSAVGFNNRIKEGDIKLDKLVEELESLENNEKDIEFKQGRYTDGGYVKLCTFKDVDPGFIEFVRDNIQTYDVTKQSEFIVIENE